MKTKIIKNLLMALIFFFISCSSTPDSSKIASLAKSWVTSSYESKDAALKMVTENMVCAGILGSENGGCYGDSGGPLVVPRSSTDDTAVVYGIAGFVKKCGHPNYPTVFMRVSKYLPWIKSFL